MGHGPNRAVAAVGPGEAGRRLGVSTRTVQRWLKEGRLPAVTIGGRLKVHPSALRETPGSDSTVIRRLLIANRGELVVRIARTCRAVGIAPIALVPSDQESAWWTRQLPERARLEGTYLDMGAVLDAARRAGADAIHPGYGFLAERADFADAVLAAGLRWVGPPGGAMRALGDKAAGRLLATRVGVPVVAGYHGDDQTDQALRGSAMHIGYPVLVKPSAGGGGVGMHTADDEATLIDLLPQARREALAAFGDDRLILERSVDRPRHVEVQLLADGHGAAVQLGERDCSLQRRHQKVIEEAPSPAVDTELRARLGEAALHLATAAGYVGAGTAEFLVDESGAFYFLEMNARLQVEHPVTECLTGRDLVADQLRIASGETLGFGQRDVRWSGHAVEARLYAEDPWNDFLPTVGRVVDTRWPVGNAVRVDAGVGPGDEIGTRYDPLLAKIVSYGNDRQTALDGLRFALTRTSVLGVTTNRGFLTALLEQPEVQRGEATTDLIRRSWQPTGEPSLEAAWRVAGAALASGGTLGGVRWGSHVGFRLNSAPHVRVGIGDEQRSVPVLSLPHHEPPWVLERGENGEGALTVDINGLAVRAVLASPPTMESAVARAQRSTTGSATVVAPMPGTVLQVRVAEGDSVEAGQVLLVLEAMKMENAIPAPGSGTVLRLAVDVGRQVGRGDVLVELS